MNIPGLSKHAALDLEIIARKIALSEQKELTALRCDIAGKERSKEYYLQAIERFLRDCKHPGGRSQQRALNPLLAAVPRFSSIYAW